MIRTTKNVKNTSTQTYGGWIMYFKLYLKFWKQIQENKSGIINPWMLTKRHQRAWCHFSLLMQTIFKPFRQFYSTRTTIEGSFRCGKNVLYNSTLQKTVTYYLFTIPFWKKWNAKLTDEEKQELIK